MSPPADSTRFRALDSLRGIAALIVVFLHCYLCIPDVIRNDHPHMAMVVAPVVMLGRFSVMLFFVLSGFVLSLPYLNGRAPSYGPYVMRRLFRLYPPYVVAVLFASVACYIVTESGTYVGWEHPLTLHMFVSPLFMVGIGPDSTSLDGSLWTLIIEMRVSLLFPLLVMIVKRFGWPSAIAGVLLAFIACSINAARGAQGEMLNQFGNDGAGALLLTLRYMWLFVLGIVAAAHLQVFKRVVTRLPPIVHGGLCLGIAAVHLFVVAGGFDRLEGVYADVFYGLVAVYFIVAAIGFASVARRLTSRLFLWLGDISYSLYLIHLPVLHAVLNSLLKLGVRYTLAVGLALPVILIVAHVMHYAVEVPSMRVGRTLSRRNRKLIPEVIEQAVPADELITTEEPALVKDIAA